MKLLDLFCGAGGAAMGYHLAGFDEIVGVDIDPQPHYPFEFVQADATTFPLDGYDAIHASPPCQDHTSLRSYQKTSHGNGWMLGATFDRFAELEVPWIVENVPGAPMQPTVILCGSQFGRFTMSDVKGEVWLRRHRLFTSNISLRQPELPDSCRGKKIIGVYGNGDGGGRGWKGSSANRKSVMGIEWMNRNELSQSIPPAYTWFLGEQIIEHIKSKETANGK